jgi:SAM-dependent methyltransferase
MLTPQQWRLRYEQQAQWTRSLRQHLFQQAEISRANEILDVGCGTGAILNELTADPSISIHGLDISFQYLEMAADITEISRLTCGDAHQLPYANNSYDLVYCHFLLLWVKHPERVIQEMLRVVRPHGAVMALAEPDYAGRIDYPDALQAIGRWQAESLRQQGANPDIGRQIKGLFARTGLCEIEAGILGAQWRQSITVEEWQMEWQVLDSDLQGMKVDSKLETLQTVDKQAWQNGERILYVPTFFVWGRKPG